jgi:hypothetical protein
MAAQSGSKAVFSCSSVQRQCSIVVVDFVGVVLSVNLPVTNPVASLPYEWVSDPSFAECSASVGSPQRTVCIGVAWRL